jgi:leucyl aminopeptidase
MPAEARFEDTNPTIHSPDDMLDVSNNTASHALKFARLATAYIAELAKGELANAPPVVSITAPGPDTALPDSKSIQLVATAIDEEDGELSPNIQWTSSRDGVLGTGAAQSARLSVGVHTITATVIDSAGAAGQATTSLTITVDANDSGGTGGCAAGGGAGVAAACASLLAGLLATRRRRASA